MSLTDYSSPSCPESCARCEHDGVCSVSIEAEATKPPEPVGYQELFDAIAAATSVACFPGINISIEDFTAKIGPLYATPQPCPKCEERKTTALNYISLTFEFEALQAKHAELEAECAAMRENSKRWHGLFDTAVASLERSENNTVIKELEAERDALQKIVDEYRDSFPRVQNQRNAFERKCDDLEQERDALAMQNQQMREALELAAKTISDLETSGDLDTETIPTLMEALALPDNTEIIKRHDAAVLAEVVERIIDSASIGSETGVEVVRTMIKEMGAQL